MAKVERVREALTSSPTAEYWQEKIEEGWRPVAVEWERSVQEDGESGAIKEEVPYGLMVADDCRYLEDNPSEIEALHRMLELIVDDRSLSEVADELNRRGFRQRSTREWTQVAIFNMLPRLIEMAPRIYSSEEWNEKQDRVLRLAR